MNRLHSPLLLGSVALLAMAHFAQAKNLTPKSQPGTNGNSIQTFVGDHHALTSERKMSSVLVDHPKRLERRTRDYAKEYNVSVQDFEFLPAKPAKKNEFLQAIPVRTSLRGSLAGVTAHLQRMALFATVQSPVSLQISWLPGTPDRYDLTSIVHYFQIANPEEFYHYGNPKMKPTQVNAVEIEQYEDRKVERMRKETAALAQRQENSLLPALLEPVVVSCQQANTKPCFEKLSWSKAKGLQIVSKKESLAHGS